MQRHDDACHYGFDEAILHPERLSVKGFGTNRKALGWMVIQGTNCIWYWDELPAGITDQELSNHFNRDALLLETGISSGTPFMSSLYP